MDDLPKTDLRAALDASELRAEGLQARLDGTRGILDAISESIYIQDAQGRFLDVNEGAVRMYGHPRSFFIGKSPEIISAPDRNDLEAVAQAFGKAFGGAPQQFEFWGLKADGTCFPKDVRLYPGTYLGQQVVIAVAQDVSERKRAEQIRDAAYRISEAALSAQDLPNLYRSVHDILRTLVSADNCYIALHDLRTNTISFPYWVDQLDEVPAPRPFGKGLTEFLIRTGLPQFIDEVRGAALYESGEVQLIGSDGFAWLGVPLRNEQRVFGALVIQSYEGGYRYQPEDLELLGFVSTQVAMAIDRRASEEQLRFISAAVDVAQDSLFWINEAGRIEFVNVAACRGLGYASDELLSMSVQDIDPSLTPEMWKAAWADVRAGVALHRETTQRRKDGTFRQVEVSRTLVMFQGREVLFSAARDISERKQVEAALLASEEKFSSSFHASPDAININRLDGTYVDINHAFTRMSGWSREETVGRTTLDLGMWVDLADRDRMQMLLKADGHFAGLEAPFRMKDGSIRTGLVSGTLIKVEGGTCLLTITRDISERKAAEAALRYSEDKFSRAFHGSPDAINITRLDNGTYLEVNEGFEKLFGWDRADAMGRSTLDLCTWAQPQDRQKVVDWIRTQGGFQGQEFQFRKKDGSFFTGLMYGKGIEVEGVPCILSITRDITEQKAAEAAIRYSEDKFSRAFRGSPDSININRLDDGVFIEVNEGFEKLTGWTRAEAIGRSSLDMDIWADPHDRQKAVDLIRTHGEYTGFEALFRKKDGSTLTGLMSAKVMDVNGVPCLLSITRDISDRKAAESALRSTELRTRTVMANSQAVIYQLDPDGRFLLSEGLGLAGLGLAPGQVVGLNAMDVYKNDLETTDQIRLALKGEASRRITKAGGRQFDNNMTPVFDAQGRLESVIGIATDVTERMQMEDALRQSQKLESLGILAGGIAHDFNNLLTVVLGNLNLAQMHLPEQTPAQPYLANMEATVLRATELTKQMLAYSGRGHFLVEPKDLNEVVREVTHLLEVSISKKVQLKFDLEPGLPAIQADTAQIQQVVMNLVTNASDAIGDREGIIHLCTSTILLEAQELLTTYRGEALKPGPYVLLEVTDTGIGMAPEVMARIFDPFFTTKATGRGLGLSAMLGILRGHGAGLRITSEVGCGSTFHICFPASAAGASAPRPTQAEDTSGLIRGRVLLVDDEDLILETIGSALEILGLEVVMARDGLEALELFRSGRPDLVLMDLTMPRMDGREAFQAMHDLDPSIPVVLSSGFTEQDSIRTLSEQNPVGFIQKPYQIKDLRQLLQRILGS
jgi:PAS domain S-box-containing protein